MENKITPEEALNNIAIAIVENFVGKDEPRRTEQINKFLNSNECQIIEQAFDELEELKRVLDILKSKVKFEVNDKSLFGFNQNNLVVNKDIFGSVSLTREEYDLLKGWLDNGTQTT